MNTHNIREKFKNFQTLFISGCSSSIIMVHMTMKPINKKEVPTKWQTQARNFKTDQKVKVNFCLT